MATSGLDKVVEHLRSIALRQEAAGMSDSKLLEGFVTARDQVAFAVLVRRYAPLVWNVCRRVLANHQDAEDAFQATFLVLVRKAASIAKRELLANWLYGVAHRTALKARTALSRRAARERQVPQMPEPEAVQDDLWSSLLPFLDQELSRLPEKYRTAIVLCDLQGKTRKDAARQLHVPEGTIASWLTRGRALLAKRLARHGLAVSGGSLAGVVAGNAQAACVPVGVVWKTIKAATLVAAGQAAGAGLISAKVAGLTEGVVRAMLINKLKMAVGVVLVAASMTGLGGGLYTYGFAARHGEESSEGAGQQAARVAQQAKLETQVKNDRKPEASKLTLIDSLNKRLEMKTFQEGGVMSLKESLGLLVDRAKFVYGEDLPILVDVEAFKAEAPRSPDFYDTKLLFPPFPDAMTIGDALRFILSRVESKNATFIVLPNLIWITTYEKASPRQKLSEKVWGVFDKRPLESVLRELSEATGTSIVIDNRASDKAKIEVSATFANGIDLAGALRALSEMADLKVLVLDGTVFVTTQPHAEALRKEKQLQLAAQKQAGLDTDPLWPYQPGARRTAVEDEANGMTDRAEGRLQQKVQGPFEKQPLSSVLNHLAKVYGTTIILDNRVGEKAKTEVSVVFRSDVSLLGAVQILAEMADLKAVIVDGAIFVTSQGHGETLKKEF
jgi:RNA polymerase sigma factor (sigma-70 family)